MGWFDDLAQPAVQPGHALFGNTGFDPNGTPPKPAQTGNPRDQLQTLNGTPPPMAGQFANNNQGFLDWATQQYGADPTRGAGFVNAQAAGGLQNMLQAYSQATGNTANFLGGPSGDRVDFGQGVQDALTSGGQIWNAAGGGGPRPNTGNGSPSSGWGGANLGSLGGGSGFTMPTAPNFTPLQTPAPFTYQPSTLGQFHGGSAVPQMQQLNYNAMGEPTRQAPIQVADPQQLQYQTYNGQQGGPTAQNAYDFRFQQGQKALENTLAHAGALRTGNAAKALTDYGQGMASQEYAAEDARQRANVGMNNANAFQFGQANIGNQFNATQANNANNLAFGNQNFNQAFQTNQANNAGNFQVGQANNQNALQQQGQQFGQNLAGYQANLGAQNQGYNQAANAYQMNANTALGFGSQNQNAALNNYQAQVAAQLGLGNLNLGYQNSNNSYALGMGNLGLAQQGQNFNQQFATNNQNYQQQVMDPWMMNYQLASLGNPGQPNGQGYANATGDLYTQQGNANAAGQVGAGNAWGNALQNLGLSAQQLAYLQALGQ